MRTQTDISILKDGFRSFFSGRSSRTSCPPFPTRHLPYAFLPCAKYWLIIAFASSIRVVPTERCTTLIAGKMSLSALSSGSASRSAQYYLPLSAPDAHLPFEPRHIDLRPAVATFFEGVRVPGGNDDMDDEVHELEHAAGRNTQHSNEEAGGQRGCISHNGDTAQAPDSIYSGPVT
jgi:hypothetical protein